MQPRSKGWIQFGFEKSQILRTDRFNAPYPRIRVLKWPREATSFLGSINRQPGMCIEK